MISFVLPQVKQVTPFLLNSSEVEIRIWGHDSSSELEEFAFPIYESGTGISQVLCILYIIFTAKTPKIIAIDEPQSFLHPGAVRKLIDIMKQHNEHQYIITVKKHEIINENRRKNLTHLPK